MYHIRYMDWVAVGELIREARRKAGFTQAALAKAMGMSRATISRLENGVLEELGVRKLVNVCDRLGLELILRERRPLTLHETYEKNRRERREAAKQTSDILAKLPPGDHA